MPVNPPSLTWLHEPEAHTYAVQWSARSDFSDATTVNDVPWNVYTHHTPLRPGRYFWRYRFRTRDGAESNWSEARRFTVPPDAVEFPMPTRAQQQERVPRAHPRLFVRPEELPRMRELGRGRLASEFSKLREAAERYIAAGPTPEPEHLGSATDKNRPDLIRYWWPNREQTERACLEAETIAFVYLLSGERKYGEAARRWILHLAAWNPDGPTNFRLNCEAAKPMLYRLPRAYDWAWDTLSESERAQVRAVMKRRALDAWESGEVGRGVGHLNRPFNSHGNRTWHKLGECAIAFLGEIPEAATWLDYAVNKFYAAYPVWADDDGGWHEGVSYWGGYMGKVVAWLQVAQTALGIDGFKKPYFARVGDYPLYVAPPGSPNMGFGDLSYRPPPAGWGGTIEFFVRAAAADPSRAAQAAYWRWWGEQWKMTPAGGIAGFLNAASLPPPPPARAPADLPPSKVFRGIGVASLHTTLLDSANDVHLLFKSSPFGSQSHGHNPQNSFQLNAWGEALLTTCVYRDLHGSEFHLRWAHSTRAHNAVLVNGEGQIPHSAGATGRIADFRLTSDWDYVEGDALAAYGGRLTRARRKILFAKPDVILLCDDLTAPQPATFQFMLHALGPFTVDETAARLSTRQSRAAVTVQYLAPVPLRFRQWDGYEPKPMREFPNQWHVEAATTNRLSELRMLTVIIPHRVGAETSWRAERLESDTALGVRLVRGRETQTLAFRKTDAVARRSTGWSSTLPCGSGNSVRSEPPRREARGCFARESPARTASGWGFAFRDSLVALPAPAQDSGAGMKLAVHLAQTLAGDVRVDFGGADARVAEQFLDDAQVGAVVEQVRGEAVPEHVRGNVAGDAGAPGAAFDPQPEGHGRERRAARGQKHVGRRARPHQLGPADLQIAVERFDGFAADGHNAFLVALADDVDEPRVQVQLLEAQVAQLRQTQARGIGQLQHRLVA